jgi:hypothetical protein
MDVMASHSAGLNGTTPVLTVLFHNFKTNKITSKSVKFKIKSSDLSTFKHPAGVLKDWLFQLLISFIINVNHSFISREIVHGLELAWCVMATTKICHLLSVHSP